jgi:penicillin amidase
LLSARNGWRAEEMLGVQKDIYSAFSHFLAGQLVDAYQKRNAHNPGMESAVGLLRSWNGQMDKNLAAPLLATLAYQHVRRAVAENASAATGLVYEFNLAPIVVERLFLIRPFDLSKERHAPRIRIDDPMRWHPGSRSPRSYWTPSCCNPSSTAR